MRFKGYKRMKIVNARYCTLNGKLLTCPRQNTSIRFEDKELILTFTTPLFITNVHAYDFKSCVEVDSASYNVILNFPDIGVSLVYKFTKSGFEKINDAINERLKLIGESEK